MRDRLRDIVKCDYRLVKVPDTWEVLSKEVCLPFFRYKDDVVGVVEENPSDNIIPYFDTKFYINLDSMNVLYMGAKGCSNFIVCNLITWCQQHNCVFSRTGILSALENFSFNRPGIESEMVKLFKADSGSLIARSILSRSNPEMAKVLYDDIVIMEAMLEKHIPTLFDGKGLRPTMTRISIILAILRTANLDYSVYACLGKPSLMQPLLTRLGIKLGTKERVLLYSYLRNDKLSVIEELDKVRNCKFADKYYQMADSFIDLERVSNRITNVISKRG